MTSSVFHADSFRASFLLTNPTGVQGVYSATGTSLEQATYSPYGTQSITSGSDVTPFGFQGSYSDATGLIYLINRYYDPSTDEFLSIDPDVSETDQPYVFVNDDPLNAEDPLGEDCGVFSFACSAFDSTKHAVDVAADVTGSFVAKYKVVIILAGLTVAAGVITGGAAFVVLPELDGVAAAEALGVGEETTSSLDISGMIMKIAELDPIPKVALVASAAAPGAITIVLGVATYNAIKSATKSSSSKSSSKKAVK